jgi:parallel beta-helix repeat protein
MFENWVVENNLVITDHWHGISFYGAINCRIVNNTVVDNDLTPSPDPWIMVTDHKDGTPSSGVIVRNNISTDYSFSGGVTEDHNIEITMNQTSTYFVNPSGGIGDYHLIVTSPAIDAGSAVSAPNIDKDGIARPQDSGFDIGAYEYNTFTSVEETVSPADFILFQNYPNPFNPTTRIKYHVAVYGFVSLKVFNVLGNEVVTLVDEEKSEGVYAFDFDGTGYSSGIYFVRFQTGTFIQTIKMMLIK